jgi:predicted transcriptional regulator
MVVEIGFADCISEIWAGLPGDSSLSAAGEGIMGCVGVSRNIGAELRALRIRNGWSVIALSKAADVSDRYIRRLESGERHNPSWEVVGRLMEAAAKEMPSP